MTSTLIKYLGCVIVQWETMRFKSWKTGFICLHFFLSFFLSSSNAHHCRSFSLLSFLWSLFKSVFSFLFSLNWFFKRDQEFQPSDADFLMDYNLEIIFSFMPNLGFILFYFINYLYEEEEDEDNAKTNSCHH